MARIGIIENSPGLGGYFAHHLEEHDHAIYPIWEELEFPSVNDHDAFILTGDYANISEGYLPMHEAEVEFIKSLGGKRSFGSCFAHQLVAEIHGGMAGRRAKRHFGWHPMEIIEEHPVFDGLQDPVFLSLNGDEVVDIPDDARLLGVNGDCHCQVLMYDNIITCQSHPEILRGPALETIDQNRKGLLDRCEDLDDILERTMPLADDASSRRFISNIIDWMLS